MTFAKRSASEREPIRKSSVESMFARNAIMLTTAASVVCGPYCVAQPPHRELTEGEKSTERRHCSLETGKSLLKDRDAGDFVDSTSSDIKSIKSGQPPIIWINGTNAYILIVEEVIHPAPH